MSDINIELIREVIDEDVSEIGDKTFELIEYRCNKGWLSISKHELSYECKKYTERKGYYIVSGLENKNSSWYQAAIFDALNDSVEYITRLTEADAICAATNEVIKLEAEYENSQ